MRARGGVAGPGAPVLLSVRPEAMTLWGPEERPTGKNAARGVLG